MQNDGTETPSLSRHSLRGSRSADRRAGRPDPRTHSSSSTSSAPSIGRGQRVGAFARAGGAALGAVTRAALRRARVGRARPSWSPRVELLVEGGRAALRSLITEDPALLQAPGRPPSERSETMRQTRRQPGSLGGVRSLRVEPAAGAGAEPAVVLFFHGGGYVFGSIESHLDMGARLAVAAGARVELVDYRLAPRHPFPAAVDDALAAYRALLDSGVAADRVVIAGDSAGGGLTTALLLEVRNRGWDRPAAGALISPWLDLTLSGKSLESNAATDFLDRAMLSTWSAYYRNGADERHPLVSPLYADLTGLPPLLVHAGGAEILLDDARALSARARDAGVDVELRIFDDMFHDWHMAAALVPEGARALDEIARFVRRRTSRSAAPQSEGAAAE